MPNPPNRPNKPATKSQSSSSQSSNSPVPTVPKPYQLVSLPKTSIDRQSPTTHDRFKPDRLTGKIKLQLTVRTTAFVASGTVAMGTDLGSPKTRGVSLIKTSVERDGKLIIPGSSLKGVVRSAYEAITLSCLCKTNARKEQIPNGYQKCKKNDPKLCPACRVFGSLNFQGLIHFTDAIATKTDFSVGFMPSLYAPSQRRQGYYINGRVAGRKFYYHTIRAVDKGQKQGIAVQQAGGTFTFTTEIKFKNLSKAELGTLLIVLGQDPAKCKIALKVGGGKPVGMGTMTVEVKEIELIKNWTNFYTDYSAEPEQLTDSALNKFMQDVMNSGHQNLIQSDQLNQLVQVLKWPTDREPPEGMY